MNIKCINCQSEKEVEADGIYTGYMKCGDCGFMKSKKVIFKSNIITFDDPMDALMCESCQ